jgi:heptosyltransferase III
MRRQQVLIFRTGHLGDTVCAIPAFRAVRRKYPQAFLSLLCDTPPNKEVSAVDVIQRLGIFDSIRSYSSRRGWVTAIKIALTVLRINPDILILLPQCRETPLEVAKKRKFLHFCGARDVRAFQTLNPPHEWQPTEARRLLQLLSRIGIPTGGADYDIVPDPVHSDSVKTKLRAAGVDWSAPFVLFCAGGKAITQRWPLDRYAGVLAAVSRELNIPVLGIGTKEEVEAYRREVIPRFPGLKFLQVPLKIPELFELMRLPTAYLGNDTGPMHVAAAIGLPVVAVLSARNSPGLWDPDVKRSLVFRHRTFCENCFLNECPREAYRCLTSISEEEVSAGTVSFLRSLLNS